MSTALTHTQSNTDHKWWIIITIMLVAILEVLDSTIVNVALPSMMPSLSANTEEITWVLTSYVVASAVMLPLTGFLSHRFGHRRLLLINITGFMFSSFICGISQSLGMMVIFRLLQGAFGASLIPLSQAILRETFPLEEQGKAMAIWGLGVVAAPVFGPTIGGLIVEHSSWRWIFYLNMPICIIGLMLTLWVIPDSQRTRQKIDWVGIALMFIGVGALQMFLDQGNSKDWFNSNFILLLAIISTLGIGFFIYRCMAFKNPVIKLPIFKDRNFALSCLSLGLFAGVFFGFLTLQPIMLETLFHYTAVTAGITMAPLGIGSAIGMVVVTPLLKRIDVKYVLVCSLLLCALGCYYLASLDLNATQGNIVFGDLFLGFGMGLFLVPLSIYSLATVPKQDITEASGLFSYARMLGSSVGISLLGTLISREMQINWQRLGTHISVFNNNLRLWLQHTHMLLKNPQTPAILAQQLHQQASMIAFIDAYYLIAICFLLLIPLVLFMNSVELKEANFAAH